MNIEWVDPRKLKENPKNRNKHSREQIERLARIIQYQGWRFPIIADKDQIIWAGHGRRLAALHLKEKTVPVCYQAFTSKEQAYAFLISDNAIAAWAELDLGEINFDLGDLGPDFNIDLLGIEDFVIEVAEKLPDGDPDEVGEPPAEPRSKLGDLYELGNHRLVCGDATSVDAVDSLIGGKKADLVFTDPPYNTGMKANNDSTRLSHMFDDSFTDEEWANLLGAMAANYWTYLKQDSALYVCLDWRRSHELVPVFKQLFHFSNLIVWDKMVHGLGSDYKYTHEFIHVFKKGKPDIDSHQGDKEYQDIWRIQRKMGRDEEHATKKPIELVERALRHASKKGDIVLDLFGGSGSTLMACETLKRKAYLMELDPRYCDVIVSRYVKYTGNKEVILNGESMTWGI